MNSNPTIERDELGFTQSDYEDKQRLVDKVGKEVDLLDGWDITVEQIDHINNISSAAHNLAVYAFYDVNFKRLQRSAYAFLRWNEHFISVVSVEDLLHQVYIDLLCGFLKLPKDGKQIKRTIAVCFQFAAVGGLEGVNVG